MKTDKLLLTCKPKMIQAQNLDSSNLDSSSFVPALFWFTRYKNLNKFQVRPLRFDFMFLEQAKKMNIIPFEWVWSHAPVTFLLEYCNFFSGFGGKTDPLNLRKIKPNWKSLNMDVAFYNTGNFRPEFFCVSLYGPWHPTKTRDKMFIVDKYLCVSFLRLACPPKYFHNKAFPNLTVVHSLLTWTASVVLWMENSRTATLA